MPGFIDVSNMSDREVQRLGHADDDYVEPTRRYASTPRPAAVGYPVKLAWAAAAAAHRINGGYVKDSEWNYDVSPPAIKREANKLMVKRWLSAGDHSNITPEDVIRGEDVKAHFNSYMFLAIAGKLNDFQSQAYKIAQMTEITSRHSLELSVMSCLPMVCEKDQAKKEFMRQLRESTQLTGEVGDKIEGEITVLSTRYNVNFNKYRIQAKLVDSFVDFWYNENITVGTVMQIKGKIKAVRDDNTTQLNYVKKV